MGAVFTEDVPGYEQEDISTQGHTSLITFCHNEFLFLHSFFTTKLPSLHIRYNKISPDQIELGKRIPDQLEEETVEADSCRCFRSHENKNLRELEHHAHKKCAEISDMQQRV